MYSDISKTMTVMILSILTIMLSGCSPGVCPSFPETEGMLAVSIDPGQPSSLSDTPSGCYKIKDSQFALIVRRDVTKPGADNLMEALFDGLNPGRGSKSSAQKVEHILQMDLVEMTKDALRDAAYGAGTPPTWDLDAGSSTTNTLEIKPYVFISPDRKSRAKIWVFLKSSLKGGGKSGSWGARYIYYVPDERPMFGEGGWFENDGALLKAAVKDGLEQAVMVMAEDASGSKSSWRQEHVKLSTRFAGADHVEALDGWILKRSDSQILFSPKIRGYYSGINIIPVSDAVIRPAK